MPILIALRKALARKRTAGDKTGLGTITQAATAIVGTGTDFLSQVELGDRLVSAGINGQVTAIVSNIALTVDSSATVAVGEAFVIRIR